MINARCPAGLAKYSSLPPEHFSRSSPAILTKPPKGMAHKQNSVPSCIQPNNFGPKPKANCSTLTPHFLAVMKCPHSCTKIKINIKTIIDSIISPKHFAPLGGPIDLQVVWPAGTDFLLFYAVKPLFQRL